MIGESIGGAHREQTGHDVLCTARFAILLVLVPRDVRPEAQTEAEAAIEEVVLDPGLRRNALTVAEIAMPLVDEGDGAVKEAAETVPVLASAAAFCESRLLTTDRPAITESTSPVGIACELPPMSGPVDAGFSS